MITLFNIWHYLALVFSLLIFMGGIALALQEEGSKYRIQVILSFGLISLFVAIFSIYAIDLYTKEAKIYRLDSKRILSNEKIMFSGVVKNEGKYEIGEVTLEIRLVNRGESAGSLKSGEFFKPNGFFDYFSYSNMHKTDKPQQIREENVIATNLKPGESRQFTIYLTYPPYFSGFSHFTEVYSH